MAERTTRSQTCAIGAALSVASSASPRYNPLNAFGSNQQGPELIGQFQSFSAHRTMPSTSQPPPSQESPTPGACIVVIPDYNGSENSASLLFGGPTLYDDDDAGDPNFPRGDPPDLPSDDDPDFPAEDLYPDDSDEASLVPPITLPLTLPPMLKSESLTSLMGPIPESSGFSECNSNLIFRTMPKLFVWGVLKLPSCSCT